MLGLSDDIVEEEEEEEEEEEDVEVAEDDRCLLERMELNGCIVQSCRCCCCWHCHCRCHCRCHCGCTCEQSHRLDLRATEHTCANITLVLDMGYRIMKFLI